MFCHFFDDVYLSYQKKITHFTSFFLLKIEFSSVQRNASIYIFIELAFVLHHGHKTNTDSCWFWCFFKYCLWGQVYLIQKWLSTEIKYNKYKLKLNIIYYSLSYIHFLNLPLETFILPLTHLVLNQRASRQ